MPTKLQLARVQPLSGSSMEPQVLVGGLIDSSFDRIRGRQPPPIVAAPLAASAVRRTTDEKAEISNAQISFEAPLAEPEAARVWAVGKGRFTVSRRLVSADCEVANQAVIMVPESGPSLNEARVRVNRKSRLLVTEDLLLGKCPRALGAG